MFKYFLLCSLFFLSTLISASNQLPLIQNDSVLSVPVVIQPTVAESGLFQHVSELSDT